MRKVLLMQLAYALAKEIQLNIEVKEWAPQRKKIPRPFFDATPCAYHVSFVLSCFGYMLKLARPASVTYT